MSRSSGKAARGECRGRAREEAEPTSSEVGTPRLCSVARPFAVHHATVSWFASSAWLSIIGGRRSATGEHKQATRTSPNAPLIKSLELWCERLTHPKHW